MDYEMLWNKIEALNITAETEAEEKNKNQYSTTLP